MYIFTNIHIQHIYTYNNIYNMLLYITSMTYIHVILYNIQQHL